MTAVLMSDQHKVTVTLVNSRATFLLSTLLENKGTFTQLIKVTIINIFKSRHFLFCSAHLKSTGLLIEGDLKTTN